MTLQASASANDRRARRTILLVEDEPFVREATRTILEHAGFEVLPAEDTRDAMKVYEDCNHGDRSGDDGYGASRRDRTAVGARAAAAVTLRLWFW